jgi:hypothetical protein
MSVPFALPRQVDCGHTTLIPGLQHLLFTSMAASQVPWDPLVQPGKHG